MPLNEFKCPKCGSTKRTFKEAPECCETPMERQLKAPNSQFLEPRDPDHKRKSVRKDMSKMARERSKNHARDREMHDFIQTNDKETAQNMGWLNDKGQKRKKIDDL